jgi:ribosomal protein L21E
MISPLLGNINNSSLAATMNGRRFWTIEFWCWDTGSGAGGSAQTKLEFNNYPHGILWRGSGTSVDHYWRNASISLGAMAATGAWAHMALVGYGDNIKHFQNGTQVADTMNAVATSAFPDPFFQGSTTGFRIGASNHTTAANQCTQGTFRKFRISVGARYLAAFTPATVYPI